jgi:hypothetical protein
MVTATLASLSFGGAFVEIAKRDIYSVARVCPVATLQNEVSFNAFYSGMLD